MTLSDIVQPALDRKLPAALVAAFLLQTAGALFWAGSAAERIATLERSTVADQQALARVAVLESQIATIRASLDRIETKLDTRPARGAP
ncbi:hypothetical protein FHS83_000956 [Rhizomicrobium palustre]|uniref:Uncharacterized protein n=1 Tax=Rhizomicrobium palustre TaxID=189966 RepID=A0A846MVQ6_9PROT|nr:hypothetical protein [Rhizomicrobium palustre]NIK87638.1 hypothetical protein [Rhizomicrobium palustre]